MSPHPSNIHRRDIAAGSPQLEYLRAALRGSEGYAKLDVRAVLAAVNALFPAGDVIDIAFWRKNGKATHVGSVTSSADRLALTSVLAGYWGRGLKRLYFGEQIGRWSLTCKTLGGYNPLVHLSGVGDRQAGETSVSLWLELIDQLFTHYLALILYRGTDATVFFKFDAICAADQQLERGVK